MTAVCFSFIVVMTSRCTWPTITHWSVTVMLKCIQAYILCITHFLLYLVRLIAISCLPWLNSQNYCYLIKSFHDGVTIGITYIRRAMVSFSCRFCMFVYLLVNLQKYRMLVRIFSRKFHVTWRITHLSPVLSLGSITLSHNSFQNFRVY